MIGTTIGAPFPTLKVELELTEQVAPNEFGIERVSLPVGGMIEYKDQTGKTIAYIKILSIFSGENETSNSSEQSSSDGERLPATSEVSGDTTTNI